MCRIRQDHIGVYHDQLPLQLLVPLDPVVTSLEWFDFAASLTVELDADIVSSESGLQ